MTDHDGEGGVVEYSVKELLRMIDVKLEVLLAGQHETDSKLSFYDGEIRRIDAHMVVIQWAVGLLAAVVGGVILKIIGVVG